MCSSTSKLPHAELTNPPASVIAVAGGSTSPACECYHVLAQWQALAGVLGAGNLHGIVCVSLCSSRVSCRGPVEYMLTIVHAA